MSRKSAPENTPPAATDAMDPRGSGTTVAPSTAAPPAPPAGPSAAASPSGNASQGARGKAPKVTVPRTVICPVSGTVFNPRATGGRCPVCGEQVVPEELVRRSKIGTRLADSRAGEWAGKEGNWKIVALIVLVLYQVGLFAWVWVELAAKHAF